MSHGNKNGNKNGNQSLARMYVKWSLLSRNAHDCVGESSVAGAHQAIELAALTTSHDDSAGAKPAGDRAVAWG